VILIFLAFAGMMAMVSLPRILRELNNLFLDIVNDIGLKQFVTSPTRQENILDLGSDLPGMSDHEAIVFCMDIESVNT